MSVNIDPTGEVWLRFRATSWEDGHNMVNDLVAAGTSRFPEGWECFTIRLQRRPLGKGRGVSVICGYRAREEHALAVTVVEAAEIFSGLEHESREARITRARPDPAPVPTPA